MMLIFLGSARSMLIVGLTIPLSILTTIISLKLAGQTINIMTLGGLALAVGMLVDDATVEVEPNKRPFVLTRSATAGTMRYCASSWSGDNVTSWKGMKGANALSLTAGMCLLQASNDGCVNSRMPLTVSVLWP